GAICPNSRSTSRCRPEFRRLRRWTPRGSCNERDSSPKVECRRRPGMLVAVSAPYSQFLLVLPPGSMKIRIVPCVVANHTFLRVYHLAAQVGSVDPYRGRMSVFGSDS